MSKLRLLLKGSFFRTAEAVVAIILGFVTLPLLNNQLGSDLYGLWVLVSSLTALMYLFDIGFASAVTQKIAYYISRSEVGKVNSIISTALAIYSLLALLIGAVTLAIAAAYHPDLHNIISSTDFKIVILLTGFSIAVEFPSKAFAGLAAAHFRFDLISIYRIFFKITSVLALIFFLWQGYKIVSVAVISLTFSILSAFAFVLMGKYIYKEMEISKALVTKESFNELFGYSVWAFLIDINQALKSRIDIFFIGSFISLAAVATYYASVRLVDYSIELLYKMLGITLPTLSAHAASGDNEKFRTDLLLINRVNCYAYILMSVAFLFLGKTVLFYWLGNNFDYETGYKVLIILIFGRLSSLAVDGYVTSLYAKGRHKMMIYTGLFETSVTALLLYIALAVLKLGVIYAALSIAAPLAISRLMLTPWLCRAQLNLERFTVLMLLSFRPLLVLLPCILILTFLDTSLPILSMQKLWVGIVLAVAIVFFMKIEMRQQEKELMLRLLQGAFRPLITLLIGSK